MSDNLVDVERAVVRVLLNDAEALVAVSEALPEARFFATQRCGQVYQAMLDLARMQVLPNVATVAEHLHVPLAQMQELAAGYSSKDAREVVYLAELVAREGQRRLLLLALREAAEMAQEPTEDVAGLAYTALQMVASTSHEMSNHRDPSILAGLADVDDLLRRAEVGGLLGYKTHIPWLNDKTYGLSPNNVWVISGPYGGRKTTMAKNLTIDALRDGACVSYFALEGGRDMTTAGLWAMLATDRLLKWKMPEEAILSDKFILLARRSEAQSTALAEARQELESWRSRLFIYDGSDGIYTEDGIAAKARRDHMLHGMGVMVVDYLQLIGKGELFKRLEPATHAMQRLIRELDICGLLLAQLNEGAIYGIGGTEGYYSAGVKGGGDPPSAADYLFRIYPVKDDPSHVQVELKKARYARRGDIQFSLNEQSGWLTGQRAVLIKKSSETP